MSIENKNLKIGFIGAGKVGSALGSALHDKGYRVSAVCSRTYKGASLTASLIPGCHAFESSSQVASTCDLIFITAPDGVILDVAETTSWLPGQMVVHTSGADSREILEAANRAGALTGVFHPLATISSTGNVDNPFDGITITIEADPPLFQILESLARALGAQTLSLRQEDRALYHASAVFVSNYVCALADIASGLWEEIGFTRQQAEKALLPLLKGAVHNLQTAGLPDCLTGPISRGDTGTLVKHIDVLEKLDAPLASTYRALGIHTTGIAARKGSITPEKAREINSILKHQGEFK
ncbi:MAG: DUF2520 domain-containing protein [Dehalococcoidales bacterium]|nr:DUF2520 domain-containing protein [Dehalococcoidales bacterium]